MTAGSVVQCDLVLIQALPVFTAGLLCVYPADDGPNRPWGVSQTRAPRSSSERYVPFVALYLPWSSHCVRGQVPFVALWMTLDTVDDHGHSG